MSWATPEQAGDITGKTVTQEMLDVAQHVLDIVTGVTEEALANLRSRDVSLLRKAVSYQAYWMSTQVDYHSRVDVDEVNQDGVMFTKGNPDAFQIAPLAMLCLRRLSWLRQRSMKVRRPGSRVDGLWNPDVVNDRDGSGWEPL